MKNTLSKTISGIIEISRGMFTILKHLFRKPITLEYPEQRPDLSQRFKGRLALRVKEDGSDRCSGCGSCVKVCPCGDLIQITKEKDENGKFIVKDFVVDMGRCIFCGNCTEVCPSKGLVMTNEFELADYSRESLIYDKKRLLLSAEESKKYDESN
ncbi:MAG: NADH-quinone oxidoreductase subunit I [Candidatus Gastranaerophilales bacterium]|nr:NADH-quinone oxidoreductase subunit I [Candidatus Gastranaerophilales bacterium]